MSNPSNWAHKLRVLRRIGVKPGQRVLDYGCGAGRTVQSLADAGFDARGFDIVDYLDEPSDRVVIGDPARLPYPTDHFDMVFSDQVFEHAHDQDRVFAELHRVTKPGGIHLHVIPARWQLIEPHIKVPLGGLIGALWWFRLWAALGIRHQFQRGTTIAEAAEFNAKFHREGINYVSTRHYRKLWRSLGYQTRFVERHYMATSDKPAIRRLAPFAAVPGIASLIRTFWVRIVALRTVPTS